MTYNDKKEIIENLSDDDLAQQLADLAYEVLKLIRAGELREIKHLEEDLAMAQEEWEYRNQHGL